MIRLLSIRLRNFRKIKEATFTPLQEGITGLSGENGAGKSSFLYGAIWALFGVRPEGVPIAGLRRQNSNVKDECSVSVLFEHEGQTIEVIRELRGKSNQTVVNIFVDGEAQTVTSVGVADQWVISRLGIDADAFTTAFVIRQKELDALVDARPAERKATIERLSGIERMSEALKNARKEENEMKKEVAVLPGSEDEVKEAEKVVSDFQNAVDTTIIEGEEDLPVLEAELNKLIEHHSELVQSQRKALDTRMSLEREKQAATHIEEQKQRLLDEKNSIPETPKDSYRSTSVITEEGKSLLKEKQGLAKKIEQARNAQSELQSALAHHQGMLEDSKRRLNIAQERSEYISNQVVSVPEHEGHVKTLKEQLDNAQKHRVELSSILSITQNQIEQSQKTLSIISENHHTETTSCPLCKHKIEDPSGLINEIQEQIQELEALASEQKTQVSTKNESISDLSARLEQGENKLSELLMLQREGQTVKEDIQNLKKTIVDTETKIANISQQLESPQNFLETALEDLQQTEKQLELMRTEFSASQNLENAEQTRKNLAQQIQEMITQQESAQRNINKLESLLEEIGEVSNEAVDKAQTQVEDKRVQVDELRTSVNNQNHQFALLKERLANAKAQLQREKALVARKEARIQLYAEKVAVSSVLDEFRKDRIGRIAPELSETATSLISSMTNGQYTEVVLDDNFTPSVIDADGNERPAAWLSGGEESAVALALRIAIGDLMTGGEGGLLWLDEVLTAQDGERRASLINTLRNTTGRQIVMINHTVDAADMVDKVITVSAKDGTISES